ncbi:hypothetical protein HYPSUDRAFT_74642, partial [Hypholoma sublateritium FD-334 SS-4]
MSVFHSIGTQEFVPDLLTHIRKSAASIAVPLDLVILQSILLCLIAGEKNLILRTPDEDVALTVQLAVWTLSCIFNIPTRKLKTRPPTSGRRSTSKRTPASATSTQPDSATAFLRSLFIPTHDEDGPGEIAKHMNNAHARRSPPYPPRFKTKRPHTEYHAHSPWVSSDNATETQAPNTTIESLSGTASTSQYPLPTGPVPSIHKPRPMYPRDAPAARLPHAYTDPLPFLADHRRRKSTTHSAKQVSRELPHALVVSNLEDAPDSVQHALAQVLATRKVVLPGGAAGDDHTWPLPAGFIAVYVCPWSATERPAIHKSLLDKFAMSTNVLVDAHIRRDYRMLPFSMAVPVRTVPVGSGDRFFSHSTPTSPAAPAVSLPTHTPPLATRALPPVHHRAVTYSGPTAYGAPYPVGPTITADIVPAGLLDALHAAHARTRLSPRLARYLADTLSAARAHPRLDAMLLTARAHEDAESLVRASRVLGLDLTGAELLRPAAIGSSTEGNATDEEDGDGDDEDDYRSALDAWASASSADAHEHEHENEPLIQGGDAASSARGGAVAQEDGAALEVLDAAEVHVARMVPRVISHRVRLRSGPEDEVLASALFGATFGPGAAVGV